MPAMRMIIVAAEYMWFLNSQVRNSGKSSTTREGHYGAKEYFLFGGLNQMGLQKPNLPLPPPLFLFFIFLQIKLASP